MLGIHASLGALTGAPEFRLDKEEAADLAKASADVLQHYPVTFLDPKTLAWINLLQTTGMLYGSRLFAYRMRRSMNAAPRQAPPAPRQPNVPSEPPPRPMMQTPDGVNGAVHPQPPTPRREVPPEAQIGEIPGVGSVKFPDDHPLIGKTKGNA